MDPGFPLLALSPRMRKGVLWRNPQRAVLFMTMRDYIALNWPHDSSYPPLAISLCSLSSVNDLQSIVSL